MKAELVLLAGLLCDQDYWSDISERLKHLAQITVFKFKGFSSIPKMAERVLDEAPEQFILVGHSMGGRVALEVVRRAPGRVQALGLLNTAVRPVAEHGPKTRGELVDLAYRHGMRSVALRWLPLMLNSNGKTPPELTQRLISMVERASPATFEKQISALLGRPDATDVLPLVSVPTLLMSATGDRWSPVTQHEEIRKAVPHAHLVMIEDAGHMAPVEQPDRVAAELRSWIDSLESQSPGSCGRDARYR